MEKLMLIFFIFSLFTNSSKAQTLVVRVDTIFNYNPSTNTYIQLTKLVPPFTGNAAKILTNDGTAYVWSDTMRANIYAAIQGKQATLVSATNIKTINGTTLLGSGDLVVSSISGNAATATALATGRTISISGDITYTSPSFDGTGNITAAATLAIVNSNTGVFGSATQVGVFTVNGKGLITAVTNTTIAIAESQVTGLVSDLAGKQATIATGTTLQYFRGDLSLATFPTTTASFTSSTNKNFVTDAQLTVIGNTSGTNTGDQTTVSGNAGTATALQTARNINGVSFNGTADITITVPIATGVSGLGSGIATFLATPSGANFAAAVSDETGSGLVVFNNSPTLITPILGTPASATLTNATGLPVSTGISGLAANMATFLATATSANLAATVSNETGSGNLVFATSPALTTPSIDAATGVSVALTGNAKWNGYSVTVPVIVTPTTGQTVAASATEWTIVNPAGTLANLAITMSNSPTDGQQIIFSFRTAITALTQVAGTGGAAIDTVTTAAAKSWVVWGYSSSLNRWVLK